jgi:hypothetical protein
MTIVTRNLEDKIDQIAGQMADVRVSMAKMAVSLETHIRRTDLLEERIESFQRTVQKAQGLGIAVGALGWLIATAAALLEIYRALHG